MRVSYFTGVFKLGRISVLHAIDFSFCALEDKVFLGKPRVLLALLEFFYVIKPV